MTVTTKLSLDLQKTCPVPTVNAVQNDRYSRSLEISMYADGEPWTIPENAEVLVSYRKSDGTGGEYDILPDGCLAWTATENLLTVALAPQMLTVSGAVSMAVSILQGEAQISTFPIILNVSRRAGPDEGESEDYYAVTRFLPVPEAAETGQYLRISAVDTNGRVTALEAVDAPTVSGEGGSYTLTEEDKEEIVNEVLASLPAAEGVGF